MPKFRVVDLRTKTIEPDQTVDASTPEAAAASALGEKAIRGGQNLKRLICRVYWPDKSGQMNMVRLYRPLLETEVKKKSRPGS